MPTPWSATSTISSCSLSLIRLGKAARAREKGVELSFDPACRLDKPFLPLGEQELISIIGNLLDNAIEATQRSPLPHAPPVIAARFGGDAAFKDPLTDLRCNANALVGDFNNQLLVAELYQHLHRRARRWRC